MKLKYIKCMIHYCKILAIPWNMIIYYIILGFKPDDNLCSGLERYVVDHKVFNNEGISIPIMYVKIHAANYCSVLESHHLCCNKYLLLDDKLDYVTKRTINKLIFNLYKGS